MIFTGNLYKRRYLEPSDWNVFSLHIENIIFDSQARVVGTGWLPHPLLLLKDPLSKDAFKNLGWMWAGSNILLSQHSDNNQVKAFRNLVKTNITDFWQTKLHVHSATLEEKSFQKSFQIEKLYFALNGIFWILDFF